MVKVEDRVELNEMVKFEKPDSFSYETFGNNINSTVGIGLITGVNLVSNTEEIKNINYSQHDQSYLYENNKITTVHSMSSYSKKSEMPVNIYLPEKISIGGNNPKPRKSKKSGLRSLWASNIRDMNPDYSKDHQVYSRNVKQITERVVTSSTNLLSKPKPSNSTNIKLAGSSNLDKNRKASSLDEQSNVFSATLPYDRSKAILPKKISIGTNDSKLKKLKFSEQRSSELSSVSDKESERFKHDAPRKLVKADKEHYNYNTEQITERVVTSSTNLLSKPKPSNSTNIKLAGSSNLDKNRKASSLDEQSNVFSATLPYDRSKAILPKKISIGTNDSKLKKLKFSEQRSSELSSVSDKESERFKHDAPRKLVKADKEHYNYNTEQITERVVTSSTNLLSKPKPSNSTNIKLAGSSNLDKNRKASNLDEQSNVFLNTLPYDRSKAILPEKTNVDANSVVVGWGLINSYFSFLSTNVAEGNQVTKVNPAIIENINSIDFLNNDT